MSPWHRPGQGVRECCPGLGYEVDALVTSEYKVLSKWITVALRAGRDFLRGSTLIAYRTWKIRKQGLKPVSQSTCIPSICALA